MSSLTHKKPPRPAYGRHLGMLSDIARCRGVAADLFGVEWLFAFVVGAALLVMPAMLVREVSGRFGYLARKRAVEAWAVLKPAALVILLNCGPELAISPWVATLALVDLFSYLLGLLFLARFYTDPASVRRSLLLLGVNFLEFVVGFAVLYAHFGVIGRLDGPTETAPGALVFFSLVTASTVGYGDLLPHAGLGRLLVSVQICASIVFLSVFIAQGVGRVGISTENN